MRAHGGGAIVNVSSATSLRLFPVWAVTRHQGGAELLSQIGRIELAESGVIVSVVYPAVTETEFHQSLRAGHFAGGPRRFPADPPELVATTIAFAIESGEAHLMVGDPPRPVVRAATTPGRAGSPGRCRPVPVGRRHAGQAAPLDQGRRRDPGHRRAGRTGRSSSPLWSGAGTRCAPSTSPGCGTAHDIGAAETVTGTCSTPARWRLRSTVSRP